MKPRGTQHSDVFVTRTDTDLIIIHRYSIIFIGRPPILFYSVLTLAVATAPETTVSPFSSDCTRFVLQIARDAILIVKQ
jgi:hypothetical protein